MRRHGAREETQISLKARAPCLLVHAARHRRIQPALGAAAALAEPGDQPS